MQITLASDFEKACAILEKDPQAELAQFQKRIINEAKEQVKEGYFQGKTLTEIETLT